MTTTINNLVDVYKGHDIRDISDDFGPKFTISFAGQILTDRESVTAAREYIDQKTNPYVVGQFLNPDVGVTAAREYIDQKTERQAQTAGNAERFARNMKLMGRHENNPDDLI